MKKFCESLKEYTMKIILKRKMKLLTKKNNMEMQKFYIMQKCKNVNL